MRRLILIAVFFLFAFSMLNAEETRTIVCFGNSYTEGLGARPSDAYPARLEKVLKDVKIINAGVRGETAEEGLRRIDRDVLAWKPRLVIVEFGTNEAFRGYLVEEALRNIERIVEIVKKEGADVILVGTRFGSFQENFDEGLRTIAQKHGTGFVLNVFEGVLNNPALKSDMYHPNAEGYRIMAERILPEVKRFLEDKAS